MSACQPPGPKDVFRYDVMGKTFYADPHRVRRVLHALLGANIQETVKAANGKDPASLAAWDRLCAATAAAFCLEPFDQGTGRGVGEAECCRVLTSFFEWEEGAASAARFRGGPARGV